MYGPVLSGAMLLEAAKRNDILQVAELLWRGVEPRPRDSDGKTPLMWAHILGHQHVVNLLNMSLGRRTPSLNDRLCLAAGLGRLDWLQDLRNEIGPGGALPSLELHRSYGIANPEPARLWDALVSFLFDKRGFNDIALRAPDNALEYAILGQHSQAFSFLLPFGFNDRAFRAAIRYNSVL
jgi:ankyrin repeat protein